MPMIPGDAAGKIVMSERAEIEKLVRDAYAHRAAGNIDGIMNCFGADPVFRLAGDEMLGVLTTEVRGREALHQTMLQLVGAWNWSDYRIDSILVDGNRAVVHSHGTMHFVPTGQKFETETLDLLTIADGRISHFLEFCDTHTMVRTMNFAA
ncbi:nuclear transport factor 2 family protein [Labrys neptuniae]